jgi:hypothetical protein
MLKIPAVIVDTHPSKQLARLAIDRTLQSGVVDRVYCFSDKPVHSESIFVRINPINTVRDYSAFLLHSLYHFIEEHHFLVIQWDGFPLRPELWREDFKEYDYIGAPWGNAPEHLAVGNGGFSLRSKKLLNALQGSPLKVDSALPESQVEDVLIGKYYRPYLESQGIHFAPRHVAALFSTEDSAPLESFGFHGVSSLAFALEESTLEEHAHEILARISREDFAYNLVIHSINSGKHRAACALQQALLQNPHKFPRITDLLRRASQG